jgi:hypothetical protein
MIDAIAILCSTICVLYVIIHTATIDRTMPWFEADGSAAERVGEDRNSASGVRTDRPVRRY